MTCSFGRGLNACYKIQRLYMEGVKIEDTSKHTPAKLNWASAYHI